jgi:hypothetical protein
MSTGISMGTEPAALPRYVNNANTELEEVKSLEEKPAAFADVELESLPPSYDHTHRRLKARHIQVLFRVLNSANYH